MINRWNIHHLFEFQAFDLYIVWLYLNTVALNYITEIDILGNFSNNLGLDFMLDLLPGLLGDMAFG